MLGMISMFLNLPRLDLWPRMWSIPEKVPCALEKKVKFIIWGWNVLYISIRSNWSIVSFKGCVSLLIFHLVDLSIGVSGVLKSPTIIVLLLISSFIPVSICLTYCDAPMLGSYIFMIVKYFLGLILWSLCNVHLWLFSQPLFYSLFYQIWVLLLLLSFGLYLHGISFSSPSLSACMCPMFRSGSLLDNIYRGLVFVSIQPVFVFCWGIQLIYV